MGSLTYFSDELENKFARAERECYGRYHVTQGEFKIARKDPEEIKEQVREAATKRDRG